VKGIMASPLLDATCNIVIIGAGPAGLNACLHAVRAKNHPRVILIDKKAPWEKPMPCAEAVGRLGFEEAVTVDQSWIRHSISKAAFHAPDDTVITYTDANKGFIIDRAAMQRDLARQCTEAGARAVFDCEVAHVFALAGGKRTVHFANGRQVVADVVIDASGPLSRFGKGEGLVCQPADLEPAYFAILDNVEIPADTVHIQVGSAIAPQGYAWIFPSEGRLANVGVLVGSDMGNKVNIRALLDTFIAGHFPHAKIVRHFAGSIPCGYTRGPVATTGLIKTGDAASTVNPVSRAGIVEALMSGGFAGDTALAMLGANSVAGIQKACKRYEKDWFRKRGKRHEKMARTKSALASVPDKDYIEAAKSLSSIPHDKLSMARIFRLSLGRFPRLVWAMRHLM
jgi:digeranylgeranylglycerophospholipid reductase